MTGPSDYVEGERVFGPPGGTFDVDWVASAAVAEGVPVARARALADRAWALLRGGTPDDRLAAELGGDPDAARIVAVALEFVRLYDARP